jgi:hypothetical protein
MDKENQQRLESLEGARKTYRWRLKHLQDNYRNYMRLGRPELAKALVPEIVYWKEWLRMLDESGLPKGKPVWGGTKKELALKVKDEYQKDEKKAAGKRKYKSEKDAAQEYFNRYSWDDTYTFETFYENVRKY